MADNEDLGQIIAGCKKGRPECFSRLVDLYAGRCYGYFCRLTGNRDVSNDLLSELFLRLVQKIRSYKGGSFDSWLFRIASNIFHDYLRSKQRHRKLMSEAVSEAAPATAEPPRSDETDHAVDRLQVQLARLDDDTRELLMLRFYSQLSFKEIAAMRSEPIGTTLSKVHRAIKRLRELME